MQQNDFQAPRGASHQSGCQMPQNAPQQNYFHQAPKPLSGMAVASLVLGIIALLTSFLPIINNLSFILAALGLIFAIVGIVGTVRGKRRGKGLAIAALVVNVVSIVVVLATQSMFSTALDEATDQISSGTPTTIESSSSGDAAADAGSDASSDAPYTVADEAITGDAYSCTITGTFTNTSSNTMSYAQVSYNLYDADGAQIGTALANTNNLASGGTWKFEAVGFESVEDVASFELVDVTTW